ncbi:MAG: hypothetical protein DMF58_18165 [Acidobacteria bacterium]|nr:MAG: hypothetical protein DMF58_18165 [Acidobacteriota bacterium]
MSKRNLSLFLICLLIPAVLFASSHREAPLITEDPAADGTDVYVFRSPDAPNTVTFVANYYPFLAAQGGPNFGHFSDNVLYEIHIDNNGDAKEDITYQFRFRSDTRNGNTFLYNTGPVTSLDSPNLNVRQFYTVTRVDGPRRGANAHQIGGEFQVAPWNIGPRSTPNYDANLATPAIGTLPNSGKVFCGPRDDPFWVDLGSIFDLLALRPLQSLHLINQPGNTKGVDGLKGYNVMSIVLQVPITDVVQSQSNQIIGVWSTSSRSHVTVRSTGLTPIQALSAPVQVSRLGMPLVNEVVIPLAFKDFFNSSEPSGDLPLFNTNDTFKNRILDPEAAKLIPVLYPGVTVPPAPRNDIVSVFLTGLDGLNKPPNVVPSEMLRVNLTTPVAASPNRMGALAGDNQGFPNGRRLTDDIVDIELQVVAGVLVSGFNKAPNNQLTQGVHFNDVPFLSTFPYLASPHSGYDSMPQGGN